jgi:hypothetical protein
MHNIIHIILSINITMPKCEFCGINQPRYKVFYSEPSCSDKENNTLFPLLYKKICLQCYCKKTNREKIMNDNFNCKKIIKC